MAKSKSSIGSVKKLNFGSRKGGKARKCKKKKSPGQSKYRGQGRI
jgi:hypothetical protein